MLSKFHGNKRLSAMVISVLVAFMLLINLSSLLGTAYADEGEFISEIDECGNPIDSGLLCVVQDTTEQIQIERGMESMQSASYFQPQQFVLALDYTPRQLEQCDIDQDGSNELLAGLTGSLNFGVVIVDVDPQLSLTPIYTSGIPAGGYYVNGVGCVDWDSDGDLDVVFVNYQGNEGLNFLINDGNMNFTEMSIDMADVNNSGLVIFDPWSPVIIHASNDNSKIRFHSNVGGTYSTWTQNSKVNGSYMEFADVNSDGIQDLFKAAASNGNGHVFEYFLGLGSGVYSDSVRVNGPTYPGSRSIAFGENGDVAFGFGGNSPDMAYWKFFTATNAYSKTDQVDTYQVPSGKGLIINRCGQEMLLTPHQGFSKISQELITEDGQILPYTLYNSNYNSWGYGAKYFEGAGVFFLDHTEGIYLLPENPCSEDLVVTKSVDNSQPTVGEQVTYEIVVSNDGLNTAYAPVMTDSLPAGLVWVSSVASDGSTCDNVNCWLNDINVGENVTVTVVVQTTGTGTFTNSAEVKTNAADINPTDNTDYAVINVIPLEADVYIDKQAPQRAFAGRVYTNSLTIGNNGPTTAFELWISDTLPVSTTLVGIRHSANMACSISGVISCTVASLTVGETELLEIAVEPSVGEIVNTASVLANSWDPNLTNNVDTVTTECQSPPDCEGPSDTVLVLDGSSSMNTIVGPNGETRWDQLSESTEHMLINADEDAWFALAIYNNGITTYTVPLTNNHQSLIDMINSYQPTGGTYIQEALEWAYDQLQTNGRGVSQSVIPFTDGAIADIGSAGTYAQTYLWPISLVYAVGTGGAQQSNLETIGEETIVVQSPLDMDFVYASIREIACEEEPVWSIVKAADPVVNMGSSYFYGFTVTVPFTMTNITLTDTLPTGIQLISGATQVGDHIEVQIGQIVPNQPYYVEIEVSPTVTDTVVNEIYGFTGLNVAGNWISVIGTIPVTTTIIGNPTGCPLGACYPEATNDSYSTEQATVMTVDAENGVLINDDDPEGDQLFAILEQSPYHGSLSLDADGSFNYAPTPSFCGTDQFTYRASDGIYDSELATVTIDVACQGLTFIYLPFTAMNISTQPTVCDTQFTFDGFDSRAVEYFGEEVTIGEVDLCADTTSVDASGLDNADGNIRCDDGCGLRFKDEEGAEVQFVWFANTQGNFMHAPLYDVPVPNGAVSVAVVVMDQHDVLIQIDDVSMVLNP